VTKAGISKDRPNSLFVQIEGDDGPGDIDIFVEGADFAYFKAPRSKTDRWILPFTGDPALLRGLPVKLTIVTPEIALEQDITVE
jgi:hypothetical protein